MNCLLRFTVTVLLLITLHPRAAAQCTAAGSQSITSALADFEARQPIDIDFDSTYCVNTDELFIFTGQVELTTDVPDYPFRVTITRVSSGATQLLDGFGDQANLNANDLYTIRFEAVSNGTAEATFRVGGLSTVYTVIVGTGLPVVWQQPLRYVAGEKEVDFSWSVSEQEDVAGYVLERSTGQEWTAVHRQSPRGGREEVTYRATDTRGERETYYRVRQLDLDGRYSFSNVVVVSPLRRLAYPNPASDRLTLPELAGTATVWLVDAMGRRYVPTRSGPELDVVALPVGVYTLVVEGQTTGQRVVISR